MSKSNVIYAQYVMGKFYVWMTSKRRPRRPNQDDEVEVDNIYDALGIALKMEKEYGPVEYGVRVMEPIRE